MLAMVEGEVSSAGRKRRVELQRKGIYVVNIESKADFPPQMSGIRVYILENTLLSRVGENSAIVEETQSFGMNC